MRLTTGERWRMVVLGVGFYFFFFFNDTATTEIYTLSLHDALPISPYPQHRDQAHELLLFIIFKGKSGHLCH